MLIYWFFLKMHFLPKGKQVSVKKAKKIRKTKEI